MILGFKESQSKFVEKINPVVVDYNKSRRVAKLLFEVGKEPNLVIFKMDISNVGMTRLIQIVYYSDQYIVYLFDKTENLTSDLGFVDFNELVLFITDMISKRKGVFSELSNF